MVLSSNLGMKYLTWESIPTCPSLKLIPVLHGTLSSEIVFVRTPSKALELSDAVPKKTPEFRFSWGVLIWKFESE